MKTIVALFLVPALYIASAEYHYSRKYRIGDQYGYKMTTFSKRGNNDQTKSIAFSKHIVYRDSKGIPYEQIKWTRFVEESSNVNYDSLLKQIPPYEISLDARRSVNLPPIPDSALTGIITDLNTFFVCLSPHTGIDKITRSGDTFTDPKIRYGDFSDEKSILFGRDCLELRHKLLALKKDTVIFESTFSYPRKEGNCSGISYNDKVGLERMENFIMIKKSGLNKIQFFKGTERIIVTSKVDRKSGILLYAEMINNLSLKMRLNCTSNLDSCTEEIPLNIIRKLILEIQK